MFTYDLLLYLDIYNKPVSIDTLWNSDYRILNIIWFTSIFRVGIRE